MSSILAFDFGTKNIGIAAGNSSTQLADELRPIKAKEGIPNWQEIEQLLNEWQTKTVVVGLPFNMDGSEMEMTRRARKFGNRLHARFACELHFFDERLTTKEAKVIAEERLQVNSNPGHMKRRKTPKESPVDSIAARLILESWWRQLTPPEE